MYPVHTHSISLSQQNICNTISTHNLIITYLRVLPISFIIAIFVVKIPLALTHILHLSTVALNFQTPGQFMDVYEGRFRANGGCGYLLKPAVMREHISVFSAHSRETIPGVAPQLLKIKVRS